MKTLSYVWNKEQTEAHLNIIGGETQVSWKDHEGKNQNLNYIIPNQTQCKSCHLLKKNYSNWANRRSIKSKKYLQWYGT